MGSQEKDKRPFRRRSYRCGLPDRQQEATLETGPHRFAVRLLDESVEGAAVQVDRDPGVEADQVVWLSTTFGHFEARVAYIRPVKPAEADGSPEEPVFRLGLEWLEEVPLPPVARTSPPTA